MKWSQGQKGWEEAFPGEGGKVFHQPHASSTGSLCSCTCLVCPFTFTTVPFVQGPQTSWHAQCKLASTKAGAHLALGSGRSQVPSALGWAQLSPGNLPEEHSSWVPACGLARVAQGPGLLGQG